MTNLESSINLAKQAAESDFLWELGMRVQSGSQARDICEKLSVPLADEKRVKAVFRLRHENPEILQEIRDDAADEGEEEMVEVVWGQNHYRKSADEKNTDLWSKVLMPLDIIDRLDVMRWMNENIAVPQNVSVDDKPGDIFKICSNVSNCQIYIIRSRSVFYATAGKWTLMNDYDILMTIIPVETVSGSGEPGKPDPSRVLKGDSKFFYLPIQTSNSVGGRRRGEWNHISIMVENTSYLSLAKKLAHAYEAETARRRKPAKAIVVKNY